MHERQISVAPIISVKEARKLLGVDGKALSDKQVGELIAALAVASRKLLRQGVVPENKQV